MSVSIEILKTGYSFIENNVMKANCTCSLVKENENVILIDTLTAWDSNYLLTALEERNLKPENVTYVIGTHGHSDHIGNLNLFTRATHVIGQSISHRDEYRLFSFDKPFKISNNIEVIATPGHTLSDVSIIARETQYGTVAIVGDLFEREEDIKNPHIWCDVAGSENPEQQFKNRSMILDLANYIIPGHGPGFIVKQELIESHKAPH